MTRRELLTVVVLGLVLLGLASRHAIADTFPVATEGFENGLNGWSVTNGTWEVGVPTSGPAPNAQGNRAYEGTGAAGTVLGGNYTDNQDSRLVGPAFVVPAATQNPRLRFWSWLETYAGDYGQVEIKAGSGDWTALSPAYSGPGRVWNQVQLDLSAYAGQSVQLAFRFHSNASATAAGWYVDSVTLVTGALQTLQVNSAQSFEDGWQDWSSEGGPWELGAPTSGPGAAHQGSHVMATVLAGNYPEWNSSVNAYAARLVSPAFTVPGAEFNPRLRFWQWYSFNAGPDYGEVQIQVGAGAWEALSRYAGNGGGVWSRPSVDLSAYAGQVVRIGFLFRAQDDSNSTPEVAPGWYLDEVTLVTGALATLTPNTPDGFEAGLRDWQVTYGTWEVGVPTSGPAPNAQGNRAYEGTGAAGTVLGGNYTDNQDSRLVGPAFVVPAATQNPRLRFWSWLETYAGDYGQVEIKAGSGDWTALSPAYSGPGRVWNQVQLDLSAYAGQSVQLAFRFHSNAGSTAAGWYVDAVTLVTGALQTLQVNTPQGFEDGWQDWSSEGGPWELGAPTSGPGAAHQGSHVMATVLAGNYPEWASSTNAYAARLVSPAFTVPGAEFNPRLRFWQWYSFNAGPDYGEVQIQVGAGAWEALSRYAGNGGGVWSRPSVDLSAYAGQVVRIGFLFHAQDDSNSTPEVAPGWYLDEVELRTGPDRFNNPEDFESSWGDWNADTLGVWEIGSALNGPPIGLPPEANASPLWEDFEDGSLDSRMAIERIGSFGTAPGIKSVTNLGSAKAFGFGRSTCAASCFRGFFTKLVITFSQPIYLSALGFREMELYGNWGSQGHVYVNGELLPNSDFGRVPVNDRVADSTSRNRAFSIEKLVSSLVLEVEDITSSSELFIDDLILVVPPYGSRAHSPTSVAGTVLTGNYPANTSARLQSPRFTVPTLAGDDRVILRLWQWYQYGTGDSGTLQIKGAYDTDWVTLLAAAPSGTSPGWQQVTVDLTPYQGQVVNLGFLHSANSDTSLGAGWYIDDLSLSQQTPSRLTLDDTASQQFTENRQGRYSVIQVPAGGHLRITLDDLDNQGINEIYVRRGALPTPGSYDYKFKVTGADQSIFVPDAGAGDWFILVYNDSGPLPGDYTLKVEVTYGVGLESLEPNRIGNTAPGSITILGAGFSPGTTLSLVGVGANYSASEVAVVTSSRIVADFDFTAIPVGTYTLRVTNGSSSAALPFTVFAGGAPKLTTKLIVPRTVGYHAVATLWVEYANEGDAAMPAPLLEVSGKQNDRRGAILSLDGTRLVQGFWTSAMPVGFSNSVQFLAHGKTPGLLQPSESGRVPIYYAGWQQPWDLSYPTINFDLSVLAADNTGVIDWASLKDFMRPSSLSDEAWTPVFANLQAQTGTTWGDYVRMVNANARYLAKLGQTVTDIRDLLAFEVMQASGLSLSSTLASAVDAQEQTPGLPLAFTRSFGAEIPSRFSLGRLGRGWSDNWDWSLSVVSDGTVTILGPSGTRRVFQPDSRGTAYFAETGDTATLSALGGGAFTLTEGGGLLRAFRTDGKLDYQQDTHGNRITCTWTGTQLTRLTHSAGPRLDLAYSGGRVESVTDSLNRRTTFTFDTSGEHLQSATDWRGDTTAYGYGQGAVDQHALTLIRQADGIESRYTYDAQGRLFKKAGCCGAPVCATYTYDTAGKVIAADALGHASQFYLDHRGRVARTVNPLGNVNSRTYDSIGRLIQATDPAGRFVTYGYDARGNLISETDALGYTSRYTYTALDRLASLIDAKGNVTRYAYESDGDLGSITYADGSRETWTYDSAGNRSTWTNRRGQTIQYTNDTLGRLETRTYPDGTEHSFTYDALGNLTSYTDPLGTTTQDYDADGRLEKITYPGDRWLSYTYDAGGRRASMTDQLGHRTDYHYDAQGRLESLSDETIAEIVRYEYDAAGRMERKTLGNGVYTIYSYDNTGQLLELVNLKPDGNILSRFAYTYDSRGRRDTMTTTYGVGDPRTDLAGRWTCNYDDTGQLVGWTAPNGRRVDYTYDALGNRLNVRIDRVNTTYAVNNLNQYTRSGETTYQYDSDGNLLFLVASDGTTTYDWSAENKLLGVDEPTGGRIIYYDATGNRVRISHDAVTKEHVIDPFGIGNVVGEYQLGAVSPLARFEYGSGLLLQRDGLGAPEFFTFDALGSTSELTKTTAAGSNHYAYLPFGELMLSIQAVPNAYLFVGESGVTADTRDLYFMRARAYNAAFGRFISADPLGLRSGENNFYRYAKNAPLSLIDPEGLQPIPGGFPGQEKLWCKSKELVCVGLGSTWKNQFPFPWDQIVPDADCEWVYKKCCKYYGCDNGGNGNGRGDGHPPPCEQTGSCDEGNSDDSQPSRPVDPNDLTGPAGYGPQHYVEATELLPYRINFENDATATAPAHNVTISNPLAANFDWSTFELTEIGFGDHLIAVPPGTQHFTTTVRMSFNGVTFEVQIEAGIRPTTGEVYARFQSLDPLTGLPPPVDVGFLPPEDGTGRGQGHVAYLVRPKAALTTGTAIRNIAQIVFDGQPPIATNLVDPHDPSKGTDPNKEALVTLDADPPASAVDALPAVSTTTSVAVSWSGTDGAGSGVGSYDLFVSVDGGSFQPWLAATAATAATYTAQNGQQLAFYSVARDNAGNREATPGAAQASTRVELPRYVLTVSRLGAGSGTVTSEPVGISCGSECSVSYISGTQVKLTATADSESSFAAWGDACADTGDCVVDMTAVRGVTATFDSNNRCQAGALIVNATSFNPGIHRRASGDSLSTTGAVQVLAGANVTFRAPLQRFGPGFRVAAGGRFQARAEAVTCPASAAVPTTAKTAPTPFLAAEPLAAPLSIARADDLPAWLQEQLSAHGVDRAAIGQALLDPQGLWLLFETAQAVDGADGNGTSDIYRLDLLAGTLRLLSRSPQGRAGNGPSRYPAADALGDWVVFQSDADDLVADDTNGATDIFLHEVPFGATRRLTLSTDQSSAHPAIAAAGLDLLYDQLDANGKRQVLADTLWGGTVPETLSLAHDPAGRPLDNHHPAISADGRFVAYLETRPTSGVRTCQVYLYDRDHRRGQRQSCPAALAAASEDARPHFSADETQVVWELPGPDDPVVVPNPLWDLEPAAP